MAAWKAETTAAQTAPLLAVCLVVATADLLVATMDFLMADQ